MANIKSKKKRIVTNETSRQRNVHWRTRVRSAVKDALGAIKANDAEQIKKTVPEALSIIDRAQAKGVLHRNTAARKKAMLQHRTSQQ